MPSTGLWIIALSDTCQEVLGGIYWNPYFCRCGCGDDLTVLSPLIKTHLGPGCPAILSGTSPADDELASCFPRRRRHAGLALFMQAPLLPFAGPIAAVSAPPAVPIAAAPASPPVQHCRILNEAASTAVRAMHLLPFVKEHAVGKTEPRAKPVCKFAAARVNATAIDHRN